MPPVLRRSSSPIQKTQRHAVLHNLVRAATCPALGRPAPSPDLDPQLPLVAPYSCFTDDRALEQLLSHTFPPFHSHHPAASQPLADPHVSTQLLPDPILIPVAHTAPNPTPPHEPAETMSISEDNSRQSSASSSRHSSRQASNSSDRRARTNNGSATRGQRRRRTAPNSNLRCEVCNQLYSRRDNLRAHQRVHTGDKPYQCRYCSQPFRWLGALRNHEGNHVRDGDQPLNPPPPAARQPPASSTRRGGPSAGSSSQHAQRHSQHSQRHSQHSQSQQHSQPQQHHRRNPTSTASSSLSHRRSQRTPPSPSHRSQAVVPDLDLNFAESLTGTNARGVVVSEEDPGVSPLFPGHGGWRVLDDLPPEHRPSDP